MKRNALALGVAAAIGVIGAAQAQPISNDGAPNPATAFDFHRDGVGHVLIAENVSASNGNGTNIHIVNTDSKNGKVVKIRVRSAVNSDDLFDFTLLMSPSDVWTGAITTNPATGAGALVTKDRSCTLPADVRTNAYNDFLLDRLPTSLTAEQRKAWSREGYVEILNMADIPGPGSAAYKADTGYTDPANQELTDGRLFKTTKHKDGVAECSESVLSPANYGGYFADMAAANKRGLDFPTGGLFGNVALINGTTNLAFSIEMAAIKATNEAGQGAQGNFVWSPQKKVAIKGGADLWTSDPLFRTVYVSGSQRALPAFFDAANQISVPRVAAFANDMPDLSTPYIGGMGTVDDPLTSVARLMQQLAATSVSNEFWNGSSYGGFTDWTFSNSLRRYQVAMDYKADQLREDLVSAYDGRVYTLPTLLDGSGTAPADWVQYYDPWNTVLDTRHGLRVCVATQGASQWDREENEPTVKFVVSPSIAGGLGFCGEVSVLSVGRAVLPTAVLGAQVAVSTISTPFKEGWMKINTSNPVGAEGYGFGNRGLPLLGHAYMKAIGQPEPGVSTNYGVSYMHRFERNTTYSAPLEF